MGSLLRYLKYAACARGFFFSYPKNNEVSPWYRSRLQCLYTRWES